MLSELEKTAQLNLIGRLIQEADKRVWIQEDYPKGHRPDISRLIPKIQISSFNTEPYKPHPRVKPEMKRIGDALTGELRLQASMNEVAWYDESTGRMFFSEGAVSLPDTALRRILYHECATSVSSGMELLSPRQYSPAQRGLVERNLEFLFAKKHRPKLEETKITKAGFREIAMVGKYSVGSLYPDSIENINEVYPTIVEIVTDQIIRRGGDSHSFDTDAQMGKVLVLDADDHSRFAGTLFSVMRYIDWRALLAAFKTGDLHQTVEYLTKYVGDKAPNVVGGLVGAMQADEEYIGMVNTQLIVNNSFIII